MGAGARRGARGGGRAWRGGHGGGTGRAKGSGAAADAICPAATAPRPKARAAAPPSIASGAARRKLAGATVWSVRYDLSDGRLTMAKPCACCTAAMRAARVRTVVWSTWDGGLAEARVETFEGYQSTNIFTHA